MAHQPDNRQRQVSEWHPIPRFAARILNNPAQNAPPLRTFPMSSILTNNGAMVALQTLKSINTDLSKTQSLISTGKSVASAKDNASVWAISKVMESDVKGFRGISDSLSLGESTVAVARQASETVTDLLTQMKSKIVAAQGENVDRTKIQTDVAALRSQIASVVGAAQFNGLNLVDGSSSGVNVLSSLDRDSSGNVTVSNINVAAQDLSVGGYTAKGVLAGSDNASANSDTAGFQLDNGTGTGLIVIDEQHRVWRHECFPCVAKRARTAQSFSLLV